MSDDPGENGSAAEWKRIEERRFRERVVQTARACFTASYEWRVGTEDDTDVPELLDDAEMFERAAAEYVKGGRP